MVFHYACFRGHVFAQSFFFYHFLPVFVFLIATCIKVVLQLAYDLQSDIGLPLVPLLLSTPSCRSGYGWWLQVFAGADGASSLLSALYSATASSVLCSREFVQRLSEVGVDVFSLVCKFAMLLLVCVTVVISSTVFVRFLFDSLPSTYAKDNHAKMRKNFKVVIRLLLRLRHVSGWRSKTVNRMVQVCFLGLAIAPMLAMRSFYTRHDCNACFDPVPVMNLHRPETFWRSYKRHVQAAAPDSHVSLADLNPPRASQRGNTCGQESDLEATCELAFRGFLVWSMVIVQWAVVALSVYTRPNVFKMMKPARSTRGARAPAGDEALQAVQGEPEALSQLEEVLVDDTNWQFVVVDACYAGLLIVSTYFVVIIVLSKGGLMYAVSVFLTVSSGQSAFYALVWFVLHWITTLSDSITYVRRKSAVDPTVHRTWFIVVLWFLAVVALLAYRLYDNVLMSVLVVYCSLNILPVVTFLMRSRWPAPPVLSSLAAPAPGDSPELDTPAPAAAAAVHTRLSLKRLDTVDTVPTRGLGGGTSTSPLSPPVSPRVPVRRRRHDGAPVASPADAEVEQEQQQEEEEQEQQQEQEVLTGLKRWCFCCRSARVRVKTPKPVRYKVYCGVGALVSLVLCVVLLAVMQRFFVSSDALPDNYTVTRLQVPQQGGAGKQAVGLSVTLGLQNISFASGHLLLRGGPSNSASTAPRNESGTFGHDWEGHVDMHAHCSVVHGLSVADYCLMAQLAYLRPESPDFDAFLGTLFPDFTLRKDFRGGSVSDGVPGHHSPSRTVFFDLYSARYNLSVIAIRGTTAYEMSDWLADVDTWVEAATFQLFSKFLPGLSLWPNTLVAQVIRIIDQVVDSLIPHSPDNPEEAELRHYYFPVMEYTKAITDRHVVLTGHSMGGGVAKIVGSRLNHRAISLSGPGIMESRGKLHVSQDAIHRNVINVVPSSDLVARVGKQGGTIVNMVCSDESPWFCHFPMNTVCSLITLCGHPTHDMECVFQREYFAPWPLALFHSTFSTLRRTLLA